MCALPWPRLAAILAVSLACRPAPGPAAPGPSGQVVKDTPAAGPDAPPVPGPPVREVAAPEPGPLAPTPEPAVWAGVVLGGPFAGVGAYCAGLPRGPRAGEEDAPPRETCRARAAGPKLSAGTGSQAAIRRARTLRIAGSIAGAPIEVCRLAIETTRGWYVTADQVTCRGVLGPSSEVTEVREMLTWASGPGAVVALEVESVRSLRSYDAAPDGNRVERFTGERLRTLRLCGVGPSQAPSCTEPVVLGCTGPEGQPVAAAWELVDGVVRFSGDLEQLLGCPGDAPTGPLRPEFP